MSTHIIPFQCKTENNPKLSHTSDYLQLWDFSQGFKTEFETAVVNEPSVFEPQKFYCNRHTVEKEMKANDGHPSMSGLIVRIKVTEGQI